MNRRNALKGIGAFLGTAASGCGSRILDAQWEPGALLAGIDTVVVLVMENRSFDHFLGARKLLEGRPVDGLTGNEWNPDLSGNPVPVHYLDDFTQNDPPHDWDAAHEQWNGGRNDGFVTCNDETPDVGVAMGYHVREQLPVTYALADAFTVCDRWHSAVMGPTWPNRYHLHGATSDGVSTNDPLPGLVSIFDLLKDAGLTGRTYFHDLPFQTSYFNFDGLAGIEQFFADAAQGTLPNFSFIDPKLTGADSNDDHPDSDIRLGQALIGSVYAALAASPHWSRCLFVVTYDEHGGFYDHVAPGTTSSPHEGFEQLGFRVPAIVAGPTVREGAVVSAPLEHVSVISTMTRRYGLPSLGKRVDEANDLSVCIDPAKVDRARIAPALPPIEVSRSGLRARLERGVRGKQHPELQDLADHGGMPRALDRRGDTDVIRRVLEAGEKLGAVRLRE